MSQTDAAVLQFARQTTGLTHEPGSLTAICAEGNPEPRVAQTKLARNLRKGDMEMTARIQGPRDAGISFTTEAYGNGTEGADGVAAVAAESTDELFRAVMGQAGVAGTGDTVSASSGTSLTVAGTDIANGDFLLLTGATSGRKQVRQVVAGGGTTSLTLDRALTEDDGTAEDAATGVAIAGVRWDLDNENQDQDTYFFDYEGKTDRHQILGAVCTALEIAVPSGGERVLLNWNFDGNDWEREGTLASPTVGTNSDGQVITAANAPLWIGNDQFMVRDMAITITRKANRKVTQFGENGYHGHATTGSEVSITGTIYLGTDDLEAIASYKDTLNGNSTQDILIQIGRTSGRILAIRAQAADFSADKVSVDGLDAIQFTATASRFASPATTSLSVATI